MADSPGSSDLSSPPSEEYEEAERLSTAVGSSRPSVDNDDAAHLAPPAKRRRTGHIPTRLNLERAPSSQPAEIEDDNISLSSDGWSSGPGSPSHDEYALREDAQVLCQWRDCTFGEASNNDDLVNHVQNTHCATGGPKKTKYTCEWGECQKKTSNHPSGYALKAHMRSHTKEKPYYCALPECDKAFTRSDALAKHMRTVHEPETSKGAGGWAPDPTSKKPAKLKLSNGTASITKTTSEPSDQSLLAAVFDEDGHQVPNPSSANDNITYIPAHHPITGQPGFMIHYPPDIHFSAWESSIAADRLMKLLRRQLHWAQQESDQLKHELEALERIKRDEWELKEVCLEGIMEAELARAESDGLLSRLDAKTLTAMEQDVALSKHIDWEVNRPYWRRRRNGAFSNAQREAGDDVSMHSRTPSPPPTCASGGFDGTGDPYDNYLTARMAEYEERERIRSLQNTPHKNVTSSSAPPIKQEAEESRQQEQQREAEADAVGALIGMSSAVRS